MPSADNNFHWPILGNREAKKYLQTLLSQKKLAHAFLFTGPKNTGKFLTSKYFALSLLCQAKGTRKPCLQCSNCSQIEKNIHADLTIIEKAEDKINITIEQIRQIQKKLSLKSFGTEYKIAIIDEADTMSEEASNALLKTLEEPTPKTIFILISHNIDLLPLTIRSRCQVIPFNLTATYQIENWLITFGESSRDAKILSHFANGRPGIANQLKSNSIMMGEHAENLKNIFQIIGGSIIDKLSIINGVLEDKKINETELGIENFLMDLLLLYRDVLLSKQNVRDITNLQQGNKILLLSRKYTNQQVVKIIQEIKETIKNLYLAANVKLSLENLALKV